MIFSIHLTIESCETFAERATDDDLFSFRRH